VAGADESRANGAPLEPVGQPGGAEAAVKAAHLIAAYLANLESHPVLPAVQPGAVRRQIPPTAPALPETLDVILGDYERFIAPNLTHWQHPGFMAYFPSVATWPGIVGEWLAAGVNSNVMLWRNAPASTELEEVVVAWLRRMMGLPDAFDGMFTDTASMSSLLAVVAARHVVPGLEARDHGLAGRTGLGRLRLYCSTEAHSSIEKAAIVAGVGHEGVRRIPADDDYRMRPEMLERAIAEDRAAGWWPFCVVATLGTTSSTSIDPIGSIAAICERESLWLHADAAYGGVAAIVPEMRGLFAGWERADSIVVNPHKWLWTPFDASLLLFRRPEAFRDAFSLVPEYLRVKKAGAPSSEADTRPSAATSPPGSSPGHLCDAYASDPDFVHNFHEYGIQLGRRFRALKLWIMLRSYGTQAIANELRRHCAMAREFTSWVEADPNWQMMAPLPLATACVRYRPAGLRGREDEPEVRRELDARNEAILESVNRSGDIFLSHTRLRDRYTIRVCIGNPRQEMRHVRRCWELLQAGGRSGPSRK
jgi:aromatic-L-amino-acid/L-tryptophan decarboxylase